MSKLPRLLALAICVGLLATAAAQAQSVVDAPGFVAGPRVIAEGLLWSSSQGVWLTSPAAGPRMLVPGVSLGSVLAGSGWIVVERPAGISAARLGRRLAAVPLLRRCLPVKRASGARLVAVAGGELYAVVRAGCLHQRGNGGDELVRIRLGRPGARSLAMVSSGAVSLAAAGPRLALTYTRPTVFGPVSVDMLSARSGQLLYRLRSPKNDLLTHPTTELDTSGDALVTGTLPVEPGPVVTGWWADARSHAVHALSGLQAGGPPYPYTDSLLVAAISDGYIAYESYTERGAQEIEVLDLATRKTRAVATFPGSASVLGVDLDNSRLAWAQQSFGFTSPTPSETCVTQTSPLGPVMLAQTDISIPSTPIVVEGDPISPRTGPLCPPPP